MAEQPAGERTEEATPRKREDARKKGTVARSSDLAGATSLLVCVIMLPAVVSKLGLGMLDAFNGAVSSPPREFSFGAALDYFSALLIPAVLTLAPLVLCLMVVGLAVNFAQVGFHFSSEAMKPTFEKINPIAGFKRLFSVRTAFEGVKAVFKLFLFSWIAYSVVYAEWRQIAELVYLPPMQASQVIGGIAHTILVRIAGVWMALAIAD